MLQSADILLLTYQKEETGSDKSVVFERSCVYPYVLNHYTLCSLYCFTCRETLLTFVPRGLEVLIRMNDSASALVTNAPLYPSTCFGCFVFLLPTVYLHSGAREHVSRIFTLPKSSLNFETFPCSLPPLSMSLHPEQAGQMSPI